MRSGKRTTTQNAHAARGGNAGNSKSISKFWGDRERERKLQESLGFALSFSASAPKEGERGGRSGVENDSFEGEPCRVTALDLTMEGQMIWVLHFYFISPLLEGLTILTIKIWF